MPKTRPLRTRFAPSPSGDLHLGNARAALFNWLAARRGGGEMILRIEDTDAARASSRRAAAIADDLRWLQLDWAGAPRRQSENAPRHARALQALARDGFAYPCFCAPEMLRAEREEMLRQGRPPRYSGRCAGLPAAQTAARIQNGEAAAVRFRMPRREIAFEDAARGAMHFCGADIGDFILQRADGGFSFFFANAVDDAADEITLVLRGEDHLSNTPRQLAILAALNMPAPVYGHLPLMLAPGGGPLSKRAGSLSLRDLRAQGFLPAALQNYLARAGCAIGADELLSAAELAAAFSLSAVSKSPSAFDEAQLLHWQKRAAQNLTAALRETWLARAFASPENSADLDSAKLESKTDSNAAATPAKLESVLESIPESKSELASESESETESENIKPENEKSAAALPPKPRQWAAFCEAVRGNTALFADARQWAEIIENAPPAAEKAQNAIAEAGADFYRAAAAAVREDMEWAAFCKRVSAATNRKGRALFLPLRAALTGRADGPEMPPLFKLIGAKKAKLRLQNAQIL